MKSGNNNSSFYCHPNSSATCFNLFGCHFYHCLVDLVRSQPRAHFTRRSEMNLLANEHELDRQQEKAIYELTLKKQRSKKSTISQRQVEAMQQLANELVTQRRDFNELIILDHNQNNLVQRSDSQVSYDTRRLCRCTESSLALAAAAAAAANGSFEHSHLDCRFTPATTTTTNSYDDKRGACREIPTKQTTSTTSLNQQDIAGAGSQLQRQSSTSTIATTSTLTSSSSSSSSSVASVTLSGSSASQLVHHRRDLHQERAAEVFADLSAESTPNSKKQPISSPSFISNVSTNFTVSTTSTTSLGVSEEASIKLNKLRLEQLNNELERRLHQYEYLVAQEKAILGAYKMNLFTNEGVNNFHLFRPDQKSLASLYKS